MVGQRLARQLGHQVQGHGQRARIAVAGRNTIDDAILAQQAVEEVGVARDPGAERGVVGQRRAGGAVRNGDDVLDGQAALVEATAGV